MSPCSESTFLFSFFIMRLKRHKKWMLMHKASVLTHLSHRGSDRAHSFFFFAFHAGAVFVVTAAFKLGLFCCVWAPQTKGPGSERPDPVSRAGGFFVLVCTGGGSGLPAPAHGAQTKQQDECFLNPTWHRGTPICPCGLTDWLNGSHSEQKKRDRF